MKVFGFEIRKAIAERVSDQKMNQFEDVLRRLAGIQAGVSDNVSPENCEQAPTVKAIVTAITRRFAVTPVHVYQKTKSNGRDAKERLPNHPVAKLLARPNEWQSRVDYWMDASSDIARYGRFYAYKSRGTTGPIRELLRICPAEISPKRDRDTWKVSFQRGNEEIPLSKIHHVRGPARDGLCGDSPVKDVSLAIALEIAAERFGASFFQNGATPFLIFNLIAGSQGFKTKEDEKQFIEDVQNAFGGGNSHRSMLLPKGFDKPTPLQIENDKSQFLETRKYQRTVIAGAWGVPPHLVGDLERATFNNVEQQDSDFTLNVIMPIGQQFEAAMERDLLTDDDRAGGVIIRFNFNSILRADFQSRQEGLKAQRENGIISANEWREIEGMNPIEKKHGGEDYIRPMNYTVAGAEPVEEPPEPNPTQQLDESIKRLKSLAEELR